MAYREAREIIALVNALHQPGRWWCIVASRVAGRRSGRHDVPRDCTSPECPGLPGGAARDLQVSQGNVLEHLVLQRQIGNKALQTDVLPLQLLHPLGLIKFKPAVLLSPSIITLLRNSGFSARYRRCLALRHQNFDLTKQHHDLLRAKPLLRHTLVPFQAHPLTKLGPRNPGQVTCARLPLFIPRECDSYSPPATGRRSKARDQATSRIRRCAHRRTVFRILEKSGTYCRHRPRPGSRSRETRRG